jgi:hypothetical protein
MSACDYSERLPVNRKLLLLFILLFSFVFLSAQQTFYWKWQVTGDSLQLTGDLQGHQKVTIIVAGSGIREKFAKVYKIIDLIEYQNANVYVHTIDTLSKQLLMPFAKQLRACKTVIIDIDSSLLGLPLELLLVDKEAMAVFRPIAFRINSRVGKEISDTLTLRKGFIIRDPTSDPEDACATIFHRYPSSIYKSAYKTTVAELSRKTDADFFLISAHGYADSLTMRGGVFLKDAQISPDLFKRNNPKLVFIDGCQQGINWTYISALTESVEPNLYLGPIISNDSGESSTKTINWFFSYLKQNGNPITALWKTRRRLYAYYHKKINSMDVANKAFIFRIYKL